MLPIYDDVPTRRTPVLTIGLILAYLWRPFWVLGKLPGAVLAGEDVVIASNGVPMVRLVPVEGRSRPRKPGEWSKLPPAASDWDSPKLNRQIARELEGTRGR